MRDTPYKDGTESAILQLFKNGQKLLKKTENKELNYIIDEKLLYNSHCFETLCLCYIYHYLSYYLYYLIDYSFNRLYVFIYFFILFFK